MYSRYVSIDLNVITLLLELQYRYTSYAETKKIIISKRNHITHLASKQKKIS